MKRSESQSLYNALPGAYISFTSSARENRKQKLSDKAVLKINYWKTKIIEKEDIYYPKIVSQIIPDLLNFKDDSKPNVEVDGKLMNLIDNRSQVSFTEIINYKDENKAQIIGNIDPILFYCPKCGEIKFLNNNNEIQNMKCTNSKCSHFGKHLNQYNRVWICSCGSSYPIDSYDVDPTRFRYFAKVKDGFVKTNGETIRINSKKCPNCGNKCTMENATDPKVFFPRIITSVKLTDDADASLCETEEGRNLIIEKYINKISQIEFEKRAQELKSKKEIPIENEKDDDDSFDFLKNLQGMRKTENYDASTESDTVYKILEYNTLKSEKKIVTTLEKSIDNAIKYNKISSKDEIDKMLYGLKIKDMSSVSNIEIINTAYGYTRMYQTAEEVRNPKEHFKLCSFYNYENVGIAKFYNVRTKTEGIIIDIDKRAMYEYLKETQKQFNFKDCSDDELTEWFINKENVDSKLIKKFQDIDLENGRYTNVITQSVYQILHTISHMFINTISKFCGIDKSSLSEMIFVNNCSIFIYSQTNQGAVLGALTQMFDKYLYELLRTVYDENKTCTFDPLCMNTSNGSCCACSYLDEVACEHFNKDLSRRLLYGYKNSKENIKNFWEEV